MDLNDHGLKQSKTLFDPILKHWILGWNGIKNIKIHFHPSKAMAFRGNFSRRLVRVSAKGSMAVPKLMTCARSEVIEGKKSLKFLDHVEIWNQGPSLNRFEHDVTCWVPLNFPRINSGSSASSASQPRSLRCFSWHLATHQPWWWAEIPAKTAMASLGNCSSHWNSALLKSSMIG